jgi:hypothetical protein
VVGRATAPRAVHDQFLVGVKITAALAGYYKTTTISGTRYLVYHRAATLKDLVTVAPGKHYECVKLQVQEYGKGTWHPGTTTGCGILNKSSRAAIGLKLSAAGRFRVRANFVPAKPDKANVSTSGSWLYHDVTK